MNFTNLSGWSVAIAVAVVVVGWIASIFAKKGMTALLSRVRGISPSSRRLHPDW
ncbi:hypothetical protein [Leifsonia poae]|uniref:hypothetical protein n=1 Tax=Leifsonia poae TaxID=110933 RepID=UPI001CBB4D01|nr:hypothetical protein [Leifsonia poae]